MARKFLTPIDLNKLELQNAAFQNLGVAPGSPSTGQFYYDTSVSPKQLKVYDGTQWVPVGNSEEEIEDIVAGLITNGTGISVSYDDNGNTLTIANTGVISLAGTTDEVEVSASAGTVTIGLPSNIIVDVTGDLTGNASTATALETARAISLSGGASGSASFNGTSDITIPVTIDSNSAVTSITGTANEIDVSASVGAVTISLPSTIDANLNGNAASATYATTAGTANAVAANSVALGTDTTGNYVATITGTPNEIEVSGSGSEGATVTIGLPDNVTVSGNLIVSGALTVSGSATYVNTEIIELADNKVILNSNATGSASQDAGIEVERGDDPNVAILWNETSDTWTLTNNGTNYHNIVRKYSTDVGNSASTQFTITHNLGTRDVVVQVYDSSTYESVEVDVARSTTSTVTLTFASAPGTNAYRVVVTG